MKKGLGVSYALLAFGAISLLAPSAGAITIVPADPTLTTQTTKPSAQVKKIAFSGSDYCGNTSIGLRINGKSLESATCGHSVFVGLWAPAPDETGGAWIDSVTLQSSPGGQGLTGVSSIGLISGSFTIDCGSPSTQLFAYDIDAGTWVTGPSLPFFACT